MKYKWDNVRNHLFGSDHVDFIIRPLEEFAKKHPKDIVNYNGVQLQIHLYAEEKFINGKVTNALASLVHVMRDQPGSSRVMITFHRQPPDLHLVNETSGMYAGEVRPRNIELRIDLPFIYAFDAEPIKKYVVYHIRFSVDREEKRRTEKDCDPLFHGYIGITKRGYMTRFMEHLEKARSNTGYLLHSVWHSLVKEGIDMNPVIQVGSTADNLKDIYSLEEEAVEKYTLTPKGLNAIPGGMAGIRMMHELRLLNSTKVGVDERDNALIALQQRAHAHGSPCAHYRRGHMRKLESGKLTYVKPCWVNLKSGEILQQAA
jgi:hypothetical protein